MNHSKVSMLALMGLALVAFAMLVGAQEVNMTLTDSHRSNAVIELQATDRGYGTPEGVFNLTEAFRIEIPENAQGQRLGPISMRPTGAPEWKIFLSPKEFPTTSFLGTFDMVANIEVLKNNRGCKTFTNQSVTGFSAIPTEGWVFFDAWDSCGVEFWGTLVTPTLAAPVFAVKDVDFDRGQFRIGEGPAEGEVTVEVNGKVMNIPRHAKIPMQANSKGTTFPTEEFVYFKSLVAAPNQPGFGSGEHPFGLDVRFGINLGEGQQDYVAVWSPADPSAKWTIQAIEQGTAGLTGEQRVIEFKVYRNDTPTGAFCHNESLTLSGLRVPGVGWKSVDAKGCGIAFRTTFNVATGNVTIANVAIKLDEAWRHPGLRKTIAENGVRGAGETITSTDGADGTTPSGGAAGGAAQTGASPGDATGFLDESGRIQQYFVVYSKDNLFNIADVIGTRRLISTEIATYRGISRAMTITGPGGRLIEKKGEVGGRLSFIKGSLNCVDCWALNAGISLDKLVLPSGTVVQGKSTPALVLRNILPGAYTVTYNFRGKQPIVMAWQISADPNAPLAESLVSGGAAGNPTSGTEQATSADAGGGGTAATGEEATGEETSGEGGTGEETPPEDSTASTETNPEGAGAQ